MADKDRLPSGTDITALMNAAPAQPNNPSPRDEADQDKPGFVSEWWGNANPMPLLRLAKGAIGMIPDMASGRGISGSNQIAIQDGARAAFENQMKPWEEAGKSAQKGDYVQSFFHGLNGLIPGAGPALDRAYGQSLEGNYRAALGGYAGLATPAAVAEAGGPVIRATGRAVGRVARPAVRSAMKPTVSAIKAAQRPGEGGLAATADDLADWALRNNVRTGDDAAAFGANMDRQVTAEVGNKPTDAALRADNRLAEMQAASAKLPVGRNPGLYQGVRDDLLNGPIGQEFGITTVSNRTIPGPPKAVTEPGIMPTTKFVPTTQNVQDLGRATWRELRPDVPADEALQAARDIRKLTDQTSLMEKGSQLDTARNAAQQEFREGVKEAYPKTRQMFDDWSSSIDVGKVLDRMALREGNRDIFSLPFWVTAAPELAAGQIPMRGLAANFLRNNQLRLGFAAKSSGASLGNASTENILRNALIAQMLGMTNPDESK